MIATVAGMVLSVSLESAVVMVGGIGISVQATPATLAELRVGAPAQVATSLVVREDALTLYGFGDEDERDVFELLLTISGVGPRLALAMLAALTPDQLRRAVADEDFATLMRVPGIGRKGAQRIVLEIAGRLGPPAGDDLPAAGTSRTESASPHVVEALVGLGWNSRAAEQAVAEAIEAGKPAQETADLLRAALVTLGAGAPVGGSTRG